MIPYARQHIDEADIAAVVEILRSDFLTQGPAIERFESAVAARVGAAHAIATSNATAALHLALCALGVGPGDRVWTSPNSFVASANCARYCGAQVDFVDIDERTYNMSASLLAQKLERAEREGSLPRVVIPVYFAGQPCEMVTIKELSQRYGFALVADAAHAIGATYRGTPAGSSEQADVTIFSFHPVKIITTGEGGMAVTGDDRLAAQMRLLRSHGVTREPEMLTANDGPWYYQQHALGFNYRLTDIGAALGTAQVARLDAFLERRRRIAARYDAALAQFEVIRPWQHPETQSSLHLYPVRVPAGARKRRHVFDAMHRAGVRVNVHYIPIHTQPYYRQLGFAPGDFPNAESYYAQTLSLPMFYELTDAEVDRVVNVLGDALGEAS